MIKATDAIQGGPESEPAADTAAHPPLSPPVLRSATENGLPPVEGIEVEPVSRAEKRRRLAQIVRVNPLDCFDDSGAFDLARAQRVLPACAVQSMVVHETTRTNRDGQTTVHRKITLRLVDKIRAMREDDILEDKQEKAVESAALKKIAHLEKALTEADNRELQFSRDIEEKDRKIEALQRARELAETRNAAPHPPPSSLSSSKTLGTAGGPELVERVEGPAPEPAKGPVERAEAQRRSWEEMAIQSKIREIEHLKNTSGHRAFSLRYPKWPEQAEARRAYALRLIKAEAEAAERQKIASAQRATELAARPTRPPRRPFTPPYGKPMFHHC